MGDVRKLYDKAYIYDYDLEGKDITVQIERVSGGVLTGKGGTKNKKPVLFFKGTEKALALNITNARVIAGMYGGFESDKWIGKRVTLYPTTTTFGAETVGCIRIRNVVPKEKGQAIRSDVPQPAESMPPTSEEIFGAEPGGEK